jgi:hypothetical protein
MIKYTTVLAGLLSRLSRSDFGKAVKNHHADKGVRALSTYDFFKMMVYGPVVRMLQRAGYRNLNAG